jgi:hypothetical protein
LKKVDEINEQVRWPSRPLKAALHLHAKGLAVIARILKPKA